MISIIIPAHQEGKNLNRLITHLLEMNVHVHAEVIVALSPESTTTVISAFTSQVSVICCKHRGRASQMNEGASRAEGSILVFLHADVKPPATFLQDIDQALKDGYDAGFFSYKFDKDDFWLNINASFTGRDGMFTGGGDQCLFIRTSTFEKLGRFNEKQLLMEDFEFFKRMKQSHVPYTIINNDLIVSARKYERNSYLRVNLSNLLLVLLFNLGYPSVRLKSIHDRLIRST